MNTKQNLKREVKKSKKIEMFLKSNPVLGYDYATELDVFDGKVIQSLHEVWIEAPYLFEGDRQCSVRRANDVMEDFTFIEKIETKKEWEEITGSEYPADRLDPSEYPSELNR